MFLYQPIFHRREMMDYSKLIDNHVNLLEDDLKELVDHILCDIIVYHRLDFRVFETLRHPERQKYLVLNKFSQTLHSRHLPNIKGKSEAVDLVYHVDGKPTWDPKYKPQYDFLGHKILEKYGDKLRWGGNFKSFYDGPHYELIKSYGYPKIS
jgi:peptidoglycan L-alanyl-D-glutamate endopeptidase CwlK